MMKTGTGIMSEFASGTSKLLVCQIQATVRGYNKQKEVNLHRGNYSKYCN